MKKYPRKWEEIDNFTHRLRVPGGWLVAVENYEFTDEAVCFVPDELGQWELEEKI